MRMPYNLYAIIIITHTTIVVSIYCALISMPTNNTSKQEVHRSKYNTTNENAHGHDWDVFTQPLFPSLPHSRGFWGVCDFERFYVVYERLLPSVQKKFKNRY